VAARRPGPSFEGKTHRRRAKNDDARMIGDDASDAFCRLRDRKAGQFGDGEIKD